MNIYYPTMKTTKKIKDLYPEKDILSTFECARIIHSDENSIMQEILLGNLVHIGNIKRIFKPLVFKRDLLNYTDKVLDCNIKSYKKGLIDILSNYPEELFDIHIMQILDMRTQYIAYYFIMDNQLELHPYYNNSINKTVIRKDYLINFLINHRRCGYNPNIIYNQFNYPNMNEDIKNSYNINFINKNPDYNNEILQEGNKIIRPFKIVNSNMKNDYRNLY